MNAIDPTTAALRVAVLRVLTDKVKAATDTSRKQAVDAMNTGDRLNPTAGDTRLAAVTKTQGRTTATVTDPDAFAAWCAEHYPTEVEHKPVVRPAWAKAVLDASKAAGQPCAPDGTLDVPGVSVSTGEPGLTVRLTPEADAAVEALWRSGAISLDGSLLELPSNLSTEGGAA